ncbi:MAG: GHMP kinase [Kiritimatiellia bacterium]|nr:GHMP kinase [Lentisphaerota bacterium]
MTNTNITLTKAIAPIRICDIGGWTDTWFAGRGAVFNIAIYPYVEVQIRAVNVGDQRDRVSINVENYGQSYAIDPEHLSYNKHPLIEAAIGVMSIPSDTGLEINIHSAAPPGASTGTSAAVSVALIGALDTLTRGRLTPHEVAAMAHSIETEKLGLQCGIQDQLCSAYGGINYIQMHAFPHASVSPLFIPNRVWWELEQRLALIYIGTPHSSSDIHKKVIADLGEHAENDARLTELRRLAGLAKNSVYDGDFDGLGGIMNANTDVQRKLHRALVCPRFEEIIEIAGDFDVLGCKVNGAGGDGGSITLLSDGDMAKKRRLLKTLADHGYQALPLYLSRQGLRVWR